MEINTVTITGYIGSEITLDSLHETADGTKAITIFICCEKENDRSSVDYIKCCAFGKNAINIERYLEKGRHVAIEGRICSDTYEKDGRTVYDTFIKIKKIRF